MDYRKYEDYLLREKKMSENTKNAYIMDLKSFERYLLGEVSASATALTGAAEQAENTDLSDVTSLQVAAYLMQLRQEGKSESTIKRRLAAMRLYFGYLQKQGLITENPAEDIKAPKTEKKKIEYIEIEDINRLMELPDDSLKGIRDRAILELMYATGVRAGELIGMKLSDVNIRMGFLKCVPENGRARIIPMGRICRRAMENYIMDARDRLLRGVESDILFTNYAGKPITRQGLWKILKEYGEKAELPISLTPQVIRNSFAVHMLQGGADIKSLQELMGHEDIAATQAYLAVVKNRIKDVYDRTHPRA